MTDGTYRPLSWRDQARLREAVKHLKSRFHSVRQAAHAEIRRIIARSRQKRGLLAALGVRPRQRTRRPRNPRGQRVPLRDTLRGARRILGRAARTTWRGTRWLSSRAQEPLLRLAERKASERASGARQGTGDGDRAAGRPDGTSRARASRERFGGERQARDGGRSAPARAPAGRDQPREARDERISALAAEGRSHREIAAEVGCGRTTVQNVLSHAAREQERASLGTERGAPADADGRVPAGSTGGIRDRGDAGNGRTAETAGTSRDSAR